MKWIINMKVKDYIRDWSNQDIHISYKGVEIYISIKDVNCVMSLEGNENISDVFRLVWELLSLYDGYFYEPVSFEVDGLAKDIEELYLYSLYITDGKWCSAELLGRAERNLSSEVLGKYDKFRNTGMADKKMIKTIVNAFYYLRSKDYGKIKANHILSLMLNIADGFVINTFKDTKNVKSSYDKFFKKTVDSIRLQYGVSLLGIDGEKYKSVLVEERNSFDHYVFSENSLASFILNSNEKVAEYGTWYFIYVLDLVIRINFLKVSGVCLKQDAIDYALESINDWIIFENNLDVKCTTHYYEMQQMFRIMER